MEETTVKILEETIKELAKPVAETVGNLALPVSKKAGSTFAEFWDLVLGSHILLAREKQKLRQNENLENYKKSIQSKIEAIPEGRLIEAPLHVVGPAIDAAKFYLESSELSEMFSNLIASAFDSNLLNKVHPSFTEVIKQMSPLDAQNIKMFKSQDLQPICDIIVRDLRQGGYTPIFNNYYLGVDSDLYNAELHSTSIVNLIRLGLVEIQDTELTNKSSYDKFFSDDLFKVLNEQYEEFFITGIFGENAKFELIKRVVRLTSFGRHFIISVIKE